MLVLQGAWSLKVNVAALVGAQDLPLWAFYLFFAPTILTLVSAYLLWTHSRWALYSLAAIPVLRLGTQLSLAPSNEQLLSSSPALRLVESLPPGQIELLLFFSGCFVYSAFMKKWGHLR
jgi:hypothetical protein